jgi:YebC/PmpR family DNA-binding regulatory protein
MKLVSKILHFSLKKNLKSDKINFIIIIGGLIMSGHSKWNNIKHKKEKTDAQKAKVFTKIGREMALVIKEGGADPASNSKLRDLISKAKANNVPNENIERAIKKASSDDASNYEACNYEGYGPSGVALIVECLTDNRNRTAADLRHYFDKFGGNMGQPGCVSFMFQRKGVIVIDRADLDEDKVMEDALNFGASDFEPSEDNFEITCEPNDFTSVKDAFESNGYTFLSAQVEYIPDTNVTLTDEEDIKKMKLLLEHLEENDDVQEVWHNLENELD